jgi:hypothetical protein
MLIIDVPKGSKALYVGENSRATIEFGLREYELLIARDTHFEVLSIDKESLHLRVVSS